MAENRTLARLRRELADLPEAGALLAEQAGLIIKLSQAATRFGEDVDGIPSALAIGMLEATRLHDAGKKTNFRRSHLAVLLAARVLSLRHAAGSFQRCSRSAIAASFEVDEGQIEEPRHSDDPALIFEACEAVAGLDYLMVSHQFAQADRESIRTADVAASCQITDRAARYRKAKARAKATVQGDLFGGL